MPWTIAHAAAVLPLHRTKKLPFSALVAGSMAPDLSYYIGLFDLAAPAHKLYPGLLMAIPSGLAMLAVWKLAGPSACLALPQPFRSELEGNLEERIGGSWRAIALTCAALLIGAFTHIAWDSLTHERGWFVYEDPGMRAPVALGAWYTLPLYRLLQHLSTIVGSLLLLFAWARMPHRIGLRQAWRLPPERMRFLLVFGLVVAASVAALFSAPVLRPGMLLEDRLSRFALAAPMWFAALLCIAGALLGSAPEPPGEGAR